MVVSAFAMRLCIAVMIVFLLILRFLLQVLYSWKIAFDIVISS